MAWGRATIHHDARMRGVRTDALPHVTADGCARVRCTCPPAPGHARRARCAALAHRRHRASEVQAWAPCRCNLA